MRTAAARRSDRLRLSSAGPWLSEKPTSASEAGAEPDHVTAGIFQLARFLRDRDGRGGLNARKGIGKKGHDGKRLH